MPTLNPEAVELRAVAPLVALPTGSPPDPAAVPQLVGAVMLVANGDRVVGVTSSELVRPLDGMPLAIVTKLDGSASIPVSSWSMGRYTGVGLVEIDTAMPSDHDVVPLPIGAVRATPETRGAPAGIAAIVAAERGYRRALVPVHVDADDGGGMSDTITHVASPIDPAHATLAVEGAPLFVWFPADPALGRPSEVLAVATLQPYRAATAKPRETPVIGELVGLEDLGRALISAPKPDERPELPEVAGEIVAESIVEAPSVAAKLDPATQS